MTIGLNAEITILNPQVWDSRIMRESWQVYYLQQLVSNYLRPIGN